MVTRKKFDRILKETIKDFEAVGFNDFANELKVILNTKNIGNLELTQVSPLIQLILGDSSLKTAQIDKEHKIMGKYLQNFFNFGVLENGLIFINKRGEA